MERKKNRSSSNKIHPILLGRRSLRAMNGTSISDETLQILFEAARWAPSHYNTQNWRFVYAKRDSIYWEPFVDALWDGNRHWAKDAAVLVVVISKRSYIYNGNLIPLPSHSFEAGSAWFAMALEGTARGLVMHAMGGYDEQKIREIIELDSDDYQVEAMVSIGNPTDETVSESTTSRHEIDQFISEGKFEEKFLKLLGWFGLEDKHRSDGNMNAPNKCNLMNNRLKTGTNCTESSDCGESTVCGKVSGSNNCVCKSGYKAASNSVDCKQISCINKAECQIYDANLICINSGCKCESSWIVAKNTQQCSLRPSLIGNICEEEDQCGANAFCDLEDNKENNESGRCKCKVGFEVDEKNFNCNQYNCANNDEYSCQQRWGKNMKCVDKKCDCNTLKGYMIDQHKQQCIQRAKFLSESCKKNIECGKNSYCYQGNCECRFGTVINENYMDCDQFYCKHDGECHQFDTNSMCVPDYKKQISTCQCRTPYYKWDPSKRECISTSSPSSASGRRQ
ncbi:hypothetical protein BLOT_006278 [Blomia tropicalis]|nr:hypothetical protein BLOT_006278 [Blomia tropicalis]